MEQAGHIKLLCIVVLPQGRFPALPLVPQTQARLRHGHSASHCCVKTQLRGSPRPSAANLVPEQPDFALRACDSAHKELASQSPGRAQLGAVRLLVGICTELRSVSGVLSACRHFILCVSMQCAHIILRRWKAAARRQSGTLLADSASRADRRVFMDCRRLASHKARRLAMARLSKFKVRRRHIHTPCLWQTRRPTKLCCRTLRATHRASTMACTHSGPLRPSTAQHTSWRMQPQPSCAQCGRLEVSLLLGRCCRVQGTSDAKQR